MKHLPDIFSKDNQSLSNQWFSDRFTCKQYKHNMGDRRFFQLCYDGDIEGVQAAIDNGADVNEEDWGATGLVIALHQGHNKWVTRASVC